MLFIFASFFCGPTGSAREVPKLWVGGVCAGALVGTCRGPGSEMVFASDGFFLESMYWAKVPSTAIFLR